MIVGEEEGLIKMIDIKTIYDKYRNGDCIEDRELVYAILFFTDLKDKLEKLGPIFRLSANEVRSVEYGLLVYYQARFDKPFYLA